MFNFLKKQDPTNFEILNEEAARAYNIRESKKFIAKTAIGIVASITVMSIALHYLEKWDKDIPLED